MSGSLCVMMLNTSDFSIEQSNCRGFCHNSRIVCRLHHNGNFWVNALSSFVLFLETVLISFCKLWCAVGKHLLSQSGVAAFGAGAWSASVFSLLMNVNNQNIALLQDYKWDLIQLSVILMLCLFCAQFCVWKTETEELKLKDYRTKTRLWQRSDWKAIFVISLSSYKQIFGKVVIKCGHPCILFIFVLWGNVLTILLMPSRFPGGT